MTRELETLQEVAAAQAAGEEIEFSLNGSGWDDWDEYYKDAAFRPGPLRQRLDKAIAEVNAQNA